MKLFTKPILKKLLSNGAKPDKDYAPVVKLFTPDAGCTWLLSEINPNEQDMAFGLCDLGLGSPELGYVYLPELKQIRGKLGLPIERDRLFKGEYPLSVYAIAASTHQHIVSDKKSLEQAHQVYLKRQREK